VRKPDRGRFFRRRRWRGGAGAAADGLEPAHQAVQRPQSPKTVQGIKRARRNAARRPQRRCPMKGTIKIGKKTEGHLDLLAKLGYEAQVDGNKIVIECNGFHDADVEVDATSQEKLFGFFAEIRKNKMLVPYNTRIKFEDGKSLSAPFNLLRLGELSAMVASPEKERKVSGPSISDLVD